MIVLIKLKKKLAYEILLYDIAQKNMLPEMDFFGVEQTLLIQMNIILSNTSIILFMILMEILLKSLKKLEIA